MKCGVRECDNEGRVQVEVRLPDVLEIGDDRVLVPVDGQHMRLLICEGCSARLQQRHGGTSFSVDADRPVRRPR